MMKSLTKSNLAIRVISASKVAMTAAAVTVTSMAFASVAEATQFTINYQGDDRTFDIYTVNDNRTDIIDLLEGSPWWGDQNLAEALAEEVGALLGLDPVTGGPYFVYNIESSIVWFSQYWNDPYEGGEMVMTGGFWDGNNNPEFYAHGSEVLPTPIPTPALLPGLLGMGVAAWRKRNGEAAEAEA
jgi:hypothetical protein